MKKIIKNTILAAVLSLSSFSIVFADGPFSSNEKENIQEEIMIDFQHPIILQVYDTEGNLLVEGNKGDAEVRTVINQSDFITKAGNTLFFVLHENKNSLDLSIMNTK